MTLKRRRRESELDSRNRYEILRESSSSTTSEAEPLEKPYLIFTQNNLKESLKISDLQELVLFVLENSIKRPSWLIIKNKDLINRVLVVYCPGLDSSQFGLESRKLPTNVEEWCLPVLDGLLPFELVWPTRCPKETFRLLSPKSAFLMTCKEQSKAEKLLNKQKTSLESLKLSWKDFQDNSFEFAKYLSHQLEFENLPNEFLQTSDFKNSRDVFALDCEMVLTDSGRELARVTLVDINFEVVVDEYIKPKNKIVDYLTRYSGIDESVLCRVTCTLDDVRKKLIQIVAKEDYLIGHSLESDLNLLRIAHSNIIDTSVIYDHTRGPPSKPGLKWLTKKWLNKDIQSSSNGHDSVEDAAASLQLVLHKLTKFRSFGHYRRDQENLLKRIGQATFIDHRISCNKKTACQSYLKLVDSDLEAIEKIIESFESGSRLVYSCFTELGLDLGWISSDTSNSTTLISERIEQDKSQFYKDYGSIYQRFNNCIKKLWSRLPKYTLFLIYSGTSDPRKVVELNKKYKTFKEEYKSRNWDDLSIQWDDLCSQDLRKFVEKASCGVSFVGLNS